MRFLAPQGTPYLGVLALCRWHFHQHSIVALFSAAVCYIALTESLHTCKEQNASCFVSKGALSLDCIMTTPSGCRMGKGVICHIIKVHANAFRYLPSCNIAQLTCLVGDWFTLASCSQLSVKIQKTVAFLTFLCSHLFPVRLPCEVKSSLCV